ncbi:3-phosphoshikimate 1-carboxyvinyltransferase [Epidermidibacterium keratini]|nr:3-phosphoshikimate 1-carboxyvinyltransferase [Epidermidibacterium keratini]
MSEQVPWRAPYAGHPVSGTVVVPGSKSLTARALVLAALSSGPSLVHNALRSRDTLLMAQALRSLGCRVDSDGESWSVVPELAPGDAYVDCGLSGTVMRFVPPLAALRPGITDFDGDPHARTRPMGPLIDGLRQCGAVIDDGGRGLLPLRVTGDRKLPGGEVAIDASGSSQFVSGLLLSAARFEYGIRLRPTGAVPNRAHVAMTLEALREHGVDAVDDGAGWRVAPGTIAPADAVIEPDASNSAPFFAAAAVTGGTVTVPHWPADSAQPIDRLLEVLSEYGADVQRADGAITVTGRERLGIDVDLANIGDMTPAIAAMCLFADSPSTIRGVGYIRGHETDRLAALATEFTGLGAQIDETDDGLQIVPRPLHGGTFATYADHRLAHAGALVGLLVDGVEVDNIATTAKAMPQFAGLWTTLVTGSDADAPAIAEMAR